MKFFVEVDKTKHGYKHVAETVLYLFPFYLEHLEEEEHPGAIRILKDVIGNVDWYKGKNQKVNTRQGFEISGTGWLGESCRAIIESADHQWCPEEYRFSYFLRQVLEDKFDTDRLKGFPKFVFNELKSAQKNKISSLVRKKFGYCYREEV